MRKSYNERMKDLREDKDLSQQQLAKLIGLSDVTVQSYEYGKSEPKISTLIKMAELYGTSIDYIAGLTDDKTPYSKSK